METPVKWPPHFGLMLLSIEASDLPDREIDYAYIIRAIKSHDALLEACKKISSMAFMCAGPLEACAYQGPPTKKWVRDEAPKLEARKKALDECAEIVKAAIALAEP